MELRAFGNTDMKVSPLGFGVMRLPMKDGGKTVNSNTIDQVDVDTSIAMIRAAIDGGVNYFDTAYNYVSGYSERILGEALKDGYREKVYVATKSPAWLYKSPEDFDRFLDEQLDRLGLDYVDNYLLHSMNGGSWKKTVRNNAIDGMKRAKASGKVRNIGFSFHDDLELFEEILNAADWDFCQIQLNYYDRDYQAGIKGMKMAAERGMAVVVMEPLRGGLLVDLPKNAQAVFDESGIKHSNVEWAFDWLWDMPEVSCVLSGMSTPEQLQQNIGYMQNAHPGMLSDEERKVLDRRKLRLIRVRQFPALAVTTVWICARTRLLSRITSAPTTWVRCMTIWSWRRISTRMRLPAMAVVPIRAQAADRAKRFARSTLPSASGFRKSTNCWENRGGHRFPA